MPRSRSSGGQLPASLTSSEWQQLAVWLGITPPTDEALKQVTPVFDAARDGWTPQAFHTKCDGISGGTITIGFGSNGVVAGGFAPEPWSSGPAAPQRPRSRQQQATGSAGITHGAFLFQLRSNQTQAQQAHAYGGLAAAMSAAAVGTFAPKYFASRLTGSDMHHHPSFGPSFGQNGNALSFLSNGANSLERTVGNFYENQGYLFGSNQVSLNQLFVFAVEHIQSAAAVPATPPRVDPIIRCDFTEAEHKTLRRKVMRFKFPRHCSMIPKVNILLFGPAGAGKSSLLCTIDAIYQGRLSRVVDTGTATTSLTRELRKLTIEVDADELDDGEDWPDELPLSIWDTMGWAEDAYRTGELNFLLDGNLSNRFRLSPDTEISPASPGFITAPTRADMVHAVAIVLPAVNALEKKTVERVTETLRYTRRRDLRTLLVLTKIDELDAGLARKPEGIYTSPKVIDLCEKAASACGVPVRDCIPIKNYAKEMRTDIRVEIPILNFLLEAQSAAKDRFRAWKDDGAAAAAAAPPATTQASSSNPPAYSSHLPEPK